MISKGPSTSIIYLIFFFVQARHSTRRTSLIPASSYLDVTVFGHCHIGRRFATSSISCSPVKSSASHEWSSAPPKSRTSCCAAYHQANFWGSTSRTHVHVATWGALRLGFNVIARRPRISYLWHVSQLEMAVMNLLCVTFRYSP